MMQTLNIPVVISAFCLCHFGTFQTSMLSVYRHYFSQNQASFANFDCMVKIIFSIHFITFSDTTPCFHKDDNAEIQNEICIKASNIVIKLYLPPAV